MTTALRSRFPHEIRDGVRLLRPDPDIPYRDGAEERLWEIVTGASDVTSDSTEMLEVAKGWAEEYHTHPARANILRALDISAGATVLEIGSGCGPITRYLGETGAQVDSVEPVLPRARVGRERTRDLPNVEVFCGNLEDVPPDPVYDLVVVVGVLEYVGGGKRDLEPYLAFLRECRIRLRPGGSLVLAIENRLGVKYLTGTGEDHSGRIFHSVEGYPRLGPAYTFSASALLELVSNGGFTPKLFSVFPDYKHTRVVLDADRLSAAEPELLETLPSFPSRYAGTRKVRLASEERVWRELVRDGVSSHFANSFLVIGDTGEPSRLWPNDRLAKYFSVNRRREYAAATNVRQTEDAIAFDRTYSPEPGTLIAEGVTSWNYVSGRSFLDVFTESDEHGRRDLLRRWMQVLRERATRGTVPLDAIPSNVLVTDEAELELIDSEFHDDAVSVDDVIGRGLFWLAINLGRTTTPETWSPARTISDIWMQLVRLAEINADDATVARLLEQEAAFQAAVTTNHMGPEALAQAQTTLRNSFGTNLGDTPLGRRLHHQYDDAVAARDRLQGLLDSSQRKLLAVQKEAAISRKQVADLRKEIANSRRADQKSQAKAKKAETALREVRRSRTFRLADRARRTVRKVVPRS